MLIPAPKVQNEPVTELSQFGVFEVESELWNGKTYHFVGAVCGGMVIGGSLTSKGTGRCSSAIKAYDVENRVGITESGRVYKLIDLSPYVGGVNKDASYVFQRWCDTNKVTKYKNVTKQFLKGNKKIMKSIIEHDGYDFIKK